MRNQQPEDITCKKIAWTIRNFSKLKTEKLYSKVFNIDHSAWQVRMFPEGKNVNDLSIYLGVADAASLPEGWSIYAEFSLTVVNQVFSELSVKRDTKHQFSANGDVWGFRPFMPLSKLHNPNNGYILNDKCIVEVEFFVVRSDQIDAEPFSHPAYLSLFKESKEIPANSNGELVDFRDLGQIDKAFVPMLEEVCLWHPSLVQCQMKRTRRFSEWAFTALGRVLQFLKAKKWKNMNEDACEHLQQLWEELETCGFDLTWLEPHVQSALDMKSYMEKAEQVKKLKKKLVALETKMKKLSIMLTCTKESIGNVRKDLIKAEEDFEERDLDAEIGYGKP